MPITLDHFRQQITSTILQRGRDYYRKNLVTECEEVEDGRWQALVEGTETYRVEIRIQQDGAVEHHCTCPYDWGPVCKHVAATLFAIEELYPEYFEKPRKTSRKPRKRKTRRDRITEILANASRQELEEALIHLALSDRDIYNQLELRFAPHLDKKAFIRIVKDALKTGVGRDGFIDYYGAMDAANGIHRVLSQASRLIEAGRVEEAIPSLQAVLETVTPALNQADDSSGALGGCIGESIHLLQEVAKRASEHLRHTLFDYLLNEAMTGEYANWGMEWDLIQVAADLLSTQKQRERLFNALEQIVQQAKETSFSYRFALERARLTQLTVIQRMDGDSAAEAFLQRYRSIPALRAKLVTFYMERQRLQEARNLCQEYLEGSQGGHPHYRQVFLRTLLQIARQEGDRESMRTLAEELFVRSGDFSYYDLLKTLVEENQWNVVRNRILGKVKGSTKADVFVREGMWKDLFEMARATGSEYFIEKYRSHLERHFPEEMCDIYERMVYDIMDGYANRATYQHACRYLQRIEKLGQRERKERIAADLRERYPRRRALHDELRKISSG